MKFRKSASMAGAALFAMAICAMPAAAATVYQVNGIVGDNNSGPIKWSADEGGQKTILNYDFLYVLSVLINNYSTALPTDYTLTMTFPSSPQAITFSDPARMYTDSHFIQDQDGNWIRAGGTDNFQASSVFASCTPANCNVMPITGNTITYTEDGTVQFTPYSGSGAFGDEYRFNGDVHFYGRVNAGDIGQQYSLSVDASPIELAAVPEPATWAMFLMGFGAIGFAMRRKNGVAIAV